MEQEVASYTIVALGQDYIMGLFLDAIWLQQKSEMMMEKKKILINQSVYFVHHRHFMRYHLKVKMLKKM